MRQSLPGSLSLSLSLSLSFSPCRSLSVFISLSLSLSTVASQALALRWLKRFRIQLPTTSTIECLQTIWRIGRRGRDTAMRGRYVPNAPSIASMTATYFFKIVRRHELKWMPPHTDPDRKILYLDCRNTSNRNHHGAGGRGRIQHRRCRCESQADVAVEEDACLGC